MDKKTIILRVLSLGVQIAGGCTHSSSRRWIQPTASRRPGT